uniref:BPTI/Kunitz inhibitor domain-containing protein n=1 Tax=Strongyloides venezuelensis TaxID=75913 RepID=A0A0K0G4K7_STRVS
MKYFIIFNLFVVLVSLTIANDDCLLPKNVGTLCDKPSKKNFYYDSKTKVCQPFMYKGCDGNDNKFDSFEQCKSACSGTTASNGKKTPEKCDSGIWAATDVNGTQLTCSECPENSKCVDNKCCYDPKYVCNLEYDAGKFPAVGSHTPRYFFAKEFNSCMIFTYYGSQGNPNNFDNFNDCMRYCKNVRLSNLD